MYHDNNEMMVAIHLMEGGLTTLAKGTQESIRLLAKAIRYFAPLLADALTPSSGVIELSKLEKLNGKGLVSIDLPDELLGKFNQFAITSNMAYSEITDPVDPNNKWIMFDKIEIEKVKRFYESNGLNVKEVEMAEQNPVSLEEAVALKEKHHYEQLGLSADTVTQQASEPMTDTQKHILKRNPEKIEEGAYLRNYERQLLHEPKNRLEATEAIAYLYNRTDEEPLYYFERELDQMNIGQGKSDPDVQIDTSKSKTVADVMKESDRKRLETVGNMIMDASEESLGKEVKMMGKELEKAGKELMEKAL